MEPGILGADIGTNLETGDLNIDVSRGDFSEAVNLDCYLADLREIFVAGLGDDIWHPYIGHNLERFVGSNMTELEILSAVNQIKKLCELDPRTKKGSVEVDDFNLESGFKIRLKTIDNQVVENLTLPLKE